MLFSRSLLCAVAAFAAAPAGFALPFWSHATVEARRPEADPDVDGTMPEDYLPGLRALVDSALHQSPDLIAKEMDIDIADAQKLYNGIAPMLPGVGGWAVYGSNSYTVSNNSSANYRNTGAQYDVALRQPVFHWGQLRDKLNQTNISVAISQRLYATAYQQFVSSLRRQYLALISAKIAVRNAHFLRDVHERALARAEEQLKSGATTSGAELNVRLDEQDAKLSSDQQDEQYAFARRQFARLLGRNDLTDGEVPDGIPAPRFSSAAAGELLAEVLRTGARYAPDSQVALLQIRNAKLDYEYWRVNLLPQISLQGEINETNQTNATLSQVTSTAVTNKSAAVRADWNIFDGLATRAHKEEALIHRRQAERELKIHAEAAMDQAQNAAHGVEFAWRALQTTEQRAAIARSLLQISEAERKRGAGSEETVAGMRNNDYNWQYALSAARANFLAAWADFVALTGHDPALNLLPARYVRPVQ